MNSTNHDAIEMDLSVFDAIPSQTNTGDRRCLLLIQKWLRSRDRYVYLEIGSHLGGTIQPHYADRQCARIYSIDKRPFTQPDERGDLYAYSENSTQTMRDNLKRAFPASDASRLETIDADASKVDTSKIQPSPDFCFIDGEHTNRALMSDLRFCLKVVNPDGILCTHDSGVVSDGIRAMKQEMTAQGIDFCGMKPGGSIYVLALGQSAGGLKKVLANELQDENLYFKSSAFYLKRQRREAALQKHPMILALWRTATRAKDRLYLNVSHRWRQNGLREKD